MAKLTQRTCPKGHKYIKSSDCPTCPICESQKVPASEFLSLLSAPARRALEAHGIKTLKKLAQWSRKDLLELHGIGPSSIPRLEKVLKAAGLTFRDT